MKRTIPDQISLINRVSIPAGHKTENLVTRFGPPAARDLAKSLSGLVSQHVRSSTFGQQRSSRCAVGGTISVRTWWSWSLGSRFFMAVTKDRMIRVSRNETISRVWRPGSTVRHSTKSSVTLSHPPTKFTTRVLWAVKPCQDIPYAYEQTEYNTSRRQRGEDSSTRSYTRTGIPPQSEVRASRYIWHNTPKPP